MHYIDLIVFLAITSVIVLIGASFVRKQSSAKEFMAASGNMPGWVVGMSIFSTFVSSISFLGYPGRAFSGNWNAFVFLLSIPFVSWIAAKWFVPFYRRQTSLSAYAFLEKRFGLWARWYASACYLLTQIARIGTIVFLLALPMNLLLGWNIYGVILMTSIAVIFYSMLGGVRGVIWTEVVQGFLIVFGALLCLFYLLSSMPEGPGQMFVMAWNADKFSLGSFDLFDLGTSTFWVCLLYGIATNLQNFGIDQNYVQRYHAARTDHEARQSIHIGNYLLVPVSLVFFLIGTALWAYYQVHPEQVPQGRADYVFPLFVVEEMPVGMAGLLIASIFAAGMGTVATSINSTSTVILTDYYKRLLKNVSDQEQLLVLKGSGIVIGLMGIFISLAMVNAENILDSWWKLSSVFSGGMLGLFFLGFIGRRVKNVEAAIGVICGFLVIARISLSNSGIHEYLAIVFGTITVFLVGFLLAYRARKLKRRFNFK